MGAVKSLSFTAGGCWKGLACKLTMQFRIDGHRKTDVQVHKLPLPLLVDINCTHTLANTTLVDLLCIGEHINSNHLCTSLFVPGLLASSTFFIS